MLPTPRDRCRCRRTVPNTHRAERFIIPSEARSILPCNPVHSHLGLAEGHGGIDFLLCQCVPSPLAQSHPAPAVEPMKRASPAGRARSCTFPPPRSFPLFFMSTSFPRSSDISQTFGAAFIGLVLSVLLSGTALVQLFLLYHGKRHREDTTLRMLVSIINVCKS